MTAIALASTWLCLSLILCLAAWFAKRRIVAISLPIAVIIAAAALYVPLGRPIPLQPSAGKYTVLGAKIVVNVGIWVLLDDGSQEPRYFRLKYTTEQANALQAAQDAAAGQQGGVQAIVGQEGGVQYDGPPPVSGEPPKQAETPAVTLP